jgi:hypothetical protein
MVDPTGFDGLPFCMEFFAPRSGVGPTPNDGIETIGVEGVQIPYAEFCQGLFDRVWSRDQGERTPPSNAGGSSSQARQGTQVREMCTFGDVINDMLVTLGDKHVSLSAEISLMRGSSKYDSVSIGITSGLQLFLNYTTSASLTGLTTASGQPIAPVTAISGGLNVGYGRSMYRDDETRAEFLGAYAYAVGGLSWDGQIGDGSVEGDLNTNVPRRLGILDGGVGWGADIVRGNVSNFTMASKPLLHAGPTKYSGCGGRLK